MYSCPRAYLAGGNAVQRRTVVPIGTNLTEFKATTSKPSSACGFVFQQAVEIERLGFSDHG
jgi:hypothetical protein